MKFAVLTVTAIMLTLDPAAFGVGDVSAATSSCTRLCQYQCINNPLEQTASESGAPECILRETRPNIPGREIGPSATDNGRLSIIAGNEKRKVRKHRRKIERRDHRRQTIEAPAGHRWVQRKDGSLVAVPLQGTALIRQGSGLKCRCRKSDEDHCTHGVESDGKTAFCSDKSQGACGTGDTCVFEGAPVPEGLRLPKAPRAVQ